MRWPLLLLVACNAPPEHKLPSSSIAPRLESRPPSTACGTDITVDGTILARYRYDYDALGRLAGATGTYTNSELVDAIEYEWDNLDHLTRFSQRRGDSMTVAVTPAYNTLGDLLDYVWTEEAPHYRAERHYSFSEFTDAGLPTRELITVNTEQMSYRLAYDAGGRIAAVTSDTGESTIYTYDDDARTTTIDTNSGAYRGVITYDEIDHELIESWDGTDASVIASEDRYEWDGDRLLVITRRSGSYDAPHALRTVEIDTYRYDCW